MRMVDIHDAKTHLSRLGDQAASGDPFIITKAGKPMVQVNPVDTHGPRKPSRFGFLAGEITVPDDFNTLGQGAIEDRFSAPVSQV